MTVFGFNMTDHLALGLLVQDIKVDLSLSDTQLGFLTGFAFALFYSTMGIPIARWADRGNRIIIVSLTTAMWSVALGLCGLVSNYAQLLLIRIGVAVGEAGCVPPAHSLIADYYSRAERPRAIAIYMMGGSVAAALGFPIAGWLNELYGWRTTFAFLGVPGVLLSMLVWFTLREPRRDGRTGVVAVAGPCAPQLTALEVLLKLWESRTFRHLLFAFQCFPSSASE